MKLLMRSCAAASIVLFLFQGTGSALTTPGDKNCPWNDLSHKWSQFINNEYPLDPKAINRGFSIQFTRDIGDLKGGACYLTFYSGNETWRSSGPIRNQDHSKLDWRKGGDPTKMEINVWGARFTFNEGGEVFFSGDGKLAGTLYCRFGDECWKHN